MDTRPLLSSGQWAATSELGDQLKILYSISFDGDNNKEPDAMCILQCYFGLAVKTLADVFYVRSAAGKARHECVL